MAIIIPSFCIDDISGNIGELLLLPKWICIRCIPSFINFISQ